MPDELTPHQPSLSELQREFCLRISELIQWTFSHEGWTLRFGEALRTRAQAQENAQAGTGIAHSLHLDRLAIDLMFDIDGKWQKDSGAYRPLGEKWKTLHPLARWGGDFSRPDGNHFSFEWGGRK